MTIDRIDPVPTQYSKAVVKGDTVHLAGLIAHDWNKDIRGQTEEVFAQIDELLAKADASKSNLVTMTVYIASFDDYAAFKETYAKWIDHAALPARATVGAVLLDPKIRIEIVAMATR